MSLIENLTTEQAQALAHPVRRGIIQTMGANDEVLSPVGFAGLCTFSLGTIAYHFRVLVRLGMLAEHSTRQRRGATEHLYTLTDAGRSLLA